MDELLDRLRRFRDERDWSQFHTPKNLAVSISIEAAELLEVFQWSRGGELEGGHSVAEVADEAADVLIYTLLLFDRIGLDPKAEVLKKIKRNELRFPVAAAYGRPGSAVKRAR
ncbi:MAG TPA: nucleotide pyrophosphohydrolase [Acetobacteraceae bacterium]|nr:nucleotide pyrophosphohydrolase [Acetobacteraceae bacterium]